MKIRFARIRNLASIRTKRAGMGAILFLLAFAVPNIISAQFKTNSTGTSQPQSNPAPLPKSSVSGSAAQSSAGKLGQKVAAGAITDIKITPEDSTLTVTVATDRLLSPQEFMVENPTRLVLDFPNTVNESSTTQYPVHAFSVKRVRVQQYQSAPNPVARVVLDLEDGYGTHEISNDKDSVRLVFRKGKSSGAASRPATAPAVKKPLAEESAAKAPVPPATPAAPKPASVAKSKPYIPEPAPKAPRPARAAKPKTPEAPPVPVPELSPVVRKAELPKAKIVFENPVVETPGQAPLVAALAPAAAAPPRMISPSNSRFSGAPLTLDLIDTNLVDFFRLMSEEGGINIVMDPEIKGKVSIKVVKVPWDQIFEAVLSNNGLDKQVEGSVVRIAKRTTLQDEAKQQESLKKANLLAADLETRIKRLNYAKASTLLKVLDDQKTVRGSIVVEDRTNSLIITDLPSSINKLMPIIEALDVAQPQVEIEARIVSSTRDFARSIGVQFGFVDGNLQRVTVGGPNTFGTIGGTRPSQTPTSAYVAGNERTGRGASESKASKSAAISTGTSTNDAGNYNVNLPSTRPYGGVGISIGNIFDTFLLDAAITAGESKGLAKLISQPKVVAQNNSPAVITQGLRFPVPVSVNNTVTVQFQNAALTLTVTPQITYEGNIVLDLKVENNSADFGKAVDGVPSIRTSESTTRVLVSDGGTTVIGGILLDDESTAEDKVPGLGSLPLIGNLFRRTSVSRSTQEVLFFVTPRIVK